MRATDEPRIFTSKYELHYFLIGGGVWHSGVARNTPLHTQFLEKVPLILGYVGVQEYRGEDFILGHVEHRRIEMTDVSRKQDRHNANNE